jgi:arylsulfatase A-like enzyme
LERSPYRDNTIVILTSDHGEGQIRHKLVRKSFLYDEAARVPFMMSWPGHIREGVLDNDHLVSGVDVVPTVCDYAGISPPAAMSGYSLRPLAEGKSSEWRDFVVAHSPGDGHMLRTDQYKYIRYDNDPTVQLFDMKKDPWETKNLAEDSASDGLVKDHHRTLEDFEKNMKLASH